jgi:hypothetical protein
LLGVVALAGFRPWATSSVAPDLSVSPGIGVGLGDSALVAHAPSPGAGTGGIAAPRSTAASTAAVSAPAPVAVSTPKQRPSGPLLAVSAGHAVETSAPVPVSVPPAAVPAPSPEPVAATPTPAPEQAPAPPLVATVDNGSPGTSGRPGTSVVGGGEPEQSCAAGEYVITVTFEEAEGEAVDYELAEADILVRGLGADGSETEVTLRGDLTDVRSLVTTLLSEGNCVQVNVVPPEGGPAEDLSEAGPDAAPGDVAEPALP